MTVVIKVIDEGLYRLTISEPKEAIESQVNCYLVEDLDKKYFLVDSGWQSSGSELIRAITSELERIEIKSLLLTHLHPDHFGGSTAIIERYSSKILFHRRETLQLTYYDLLRKNLTHAANALGSPVDILGAARARITASLTILPKFHEFLRDGRIIRGRSGSWRVIHTPGHTPGHICLYRPADGILISGDHILAEETPNIAFYPVPRYNALQSYLASLAKVKKLGPRIVLPAHGDVISDLAARVDGLAAHHHNRLFQIFKELREDPHSVAELAHSVKWSRGQFESLNHFDKWLAILETISHLEFLVECSVARRTRGAERSYKLATSNWSLVEKSMANLLALK